MKTSQFIAKIFGLYCLIFSVILLVNGNEFFGLMKELIDEPGFILMGAFLNLMLGLAMVVGHNVWDGTWRVVITILGWVSLGKGIILLTWPEALLGMSREMLGTQTNLTIPYVVFMIPFGAWLVWLGFRGERGAPQVAQEEH